MTPNEIPSSITGVMPARKDYQFLAWTIDGSKIFSTCVRRQYMAIIVGTDGRVVGTGYNGTPPGMGHCTDGHCPRVTADPEHGSNYANCKSCHSETNAIMYSDQHLRRDGTLYVNGPPCWDCAKIICGSGIKRVVHLTDDAYPDWPKVLDFFTEAGVKVVSISPGDPMLLWTPTHTLEHSS